MCLEKLHWSAFKCNFCLKFILMPTYWLCGWGEQGKMNSFSVLMEHGQKNTDFDSTGLCFTIIHKGQFCPFFSAFVLKTGRWWLPMENSLLAIIGCIYILSFFFFLMSINVHCPSRKNKCKEEEEYDQM